MALGRHIPSSPAQPVGVPAVVASQRVDHPVHPPGVVVVKRPRPQRARLAEKKQDAFEIVNLASDSSTY
jgi:hypothetical protein